MALDSLDELWALPPEARKEKIAESARLYIQEAYEINPQKFCSSKSFQKRHRSLYEPEARMQWRSQGGDERWLEVGQIWIESAREEFDRLCSFRAE